MVFSSAGEDPVMALHSARFTLFEIQARTISGLQQII